VETGYYFLFDTRQDDSGSALHRIDFGRLFAQHIVLLIVTAAAFVSLRPGKLRERAKPETT
jgi:hypothetical protein